jgi:hypothetical protein
MKRINDRMDVKVAVANSAGAADLALVSTAVNATGYSRARFVFSFGNGGATTGALSTGFGAWQAATSGATYALITAASGVAVTSGVISDGAKVAVIDVPISGGTPWLKFSGSFTSTGVPHGCVVELYHGVSNPPSSSAQQLVVV